MQLEKVVHIKLHDTQVKMEGRGLFCAACGDFERVFAARGLFKDLVTRDY